MGDPYGYSYSTWRNIPDYAKQSIRRQQESSNAVDDVADAISDAYRNVKNRLGNYCSSVENSINNFKNRISRTIPDFIRPDLPFRTNTLVSDVGDALGNAYDGIKSRMKRYIAGVEAGASALENKATGLIPDIPIPDFPDQVTGLVSTVGDKLGGVFNGVKNKVSSLISSAESGVQSLSNNINKLIPDIDISLDSITSSISSGIGGFLGDVQSGIGSMVSRVNSFASGIADTVGNSLNSFRNKVQNFGDDMVSGIQEGIDSFSSKIQSFGQEAIDTVESGIGKVASGIKGTIGALSEALAGLGGMLFTALKNAMTWILDQLKALLEFTGKVAHQSVDNLQGLE